MYSEILNTPHANHNSAGFEQQPLLKALGETHIVDAQQMAASFELPLRDEAELWVVGAVQQYVHKALWYEPQSSLERMHKDQTATCLGYTIVGSECLDSVGVRHWVGFANNHAFLIVPTSNGMWLTDFLSPELNTEISDAISSGDRNKIEADLEQQKRAAIKLHTDLLTGEDPQKLEKLARTHEWLVVDRKQNTNLPKFGKNIDNTIRHNASARTTLIVSIFPSEIGREVLQTYGGFRKALNKNEPETAAKFLEKIAGLYPDIDARGDSFKNVKALVRNLAQDGKAKEAKSVVNSFFSSFSVSGDSRPMEWEGDCLRIVAEMCKDSEAAEQAEQRYKVAASKPQAFGSVAVKKHVAAKLATSLKETAAA